MASKLLKSSLPHIRTSLTTLSNGLRVASEPIFGQYCTVGVAIDTGSRREAQYPQGTCHFIEKLAFWKSLNYPDKAETNKLLDESGALIDCQSTKDTFIYASSCHRNSAERVLSVIGDAVLRPLISEEDVELAAAIIRYENENMEKNPEPEPLLTDWIHAAAFRDNTVGLSKYCPSREAEKVRPQHLYAFLSQYYTPDRIVLAGVGVEHKMLVEAGEKYFASESIWAKDSSVLPKEIPPVDDSLAQYTGGEMRITRDLSQMALGPTPFPDLAHLVIGFRGVSLSHRDFVPFCVLQSLLGGGGSFSAGGPGKGMFTRLYVDVLYNHNWIYNATAFNHSYADDGLFCIRASAPPKKMGVLPAVILNEFHRLLKGVEKQELDRAKVQLKSQLMMNLEMRPVMFEDLARQVVAHNKRKTAQEYVEMIERVQNEDLVRIAERMLQSKMSLVGYGNLRELPSYEKISKM